MKSRILVVLLVCAISACVRIDIGDNIPTIGRQIADLTEAYESGLISSDEFRDMKRKIMRSLTQ